MQILCISHLFNYCSWQWMPFIESVTRLGARRGTGKEKEHSSGFQGFQSGMFIKLWNICDHLFICDICDLCSYAILSIFGARVHKLPHTDCCVIIECSIMHYNKSCRFFFFFFGIVQFSNMTNSELSLYLIMH